MNRLLRKDEKDKIYIVHSGYYNKIGLKISINLSDYNKEQLLFEEKSTYILFPKINKS